MNGSDWRLATGDWSNGNDVGVAISHETAANSEWRLATGQRAAMLAWLSATTENGSDWRIASGEW
ncbi:MAG: hypothetical protein ACO2PK_06990 [Armatimonadota bacterium]